MTVENSKIGYLHDEKCRKERGRQDFFLALGQSKTSKATHLLTHFHISRLKLQRDRRVQYAYNQ